MHSFLKLGTTCRTNARRIFDVTHTYAYMLSIFVGMMIMLALALCIAHTQQWYYAHAKK
jgi:hypothetical protein